jgi:electron transport complex protein RnfG
MLATNMFRTAVLLTLFAVVCTVLVAYTFESTRGRIAKSEREALLQSLHSVIPPEMHDNDLFSDVILVTSKKYLGTDQPVPVFRARKNGKPVAAILTPIAPDGYNGAIKLIIGIRYDGTIIGVRVLQHNETPGLGDAIEVRRSPWIHVFDGRSLQNPGKEGWKVKRDGGDFDQITGATITPRAVVKAVHNALLYFAKNKKHLFEQKSPAQPPEESLPMQPHKADT